MVAHTDDTSRPTGSGPHSPATALECAIAASPEACPECSTPLQHVQRETVCPDCGLVVAVDRLDRGPEWRSFDEDPGSTSSKRTGPPRDPTQHDYGLGSVIGYDDIDDGRRRAQIARWRPQQSSARLETDNDRGLAALCGEIGRIASQCSLPAPVTERAIAIGRLIDEDGADGFQGQDLDRLAAALVHAACREHDHPCSFEEIAAVAHVGADRIRRQYFRLHKEVEIRATPPSPTTWIPSLAARLDVPQRIEQQAADLAAEAAVTFDAQAGHSPSAIAAGALWAAVRLETTRQSDAAYRTQQAISDAAGVSTAALRSAVDQLESVADIDVRRT